MNMKTKLVFVFSCILILCTVTGSIAIYLTTYNHATAESYAEMENNFKEIMKDIPLEDWDKGNVSAGIFFNEGYMTVYKKNKVSYKKEVHGGRPGEEEKLNKALNGQKYSRYLGPFITSFGMSISDKTNDYFVAFTFYNRDLNEMLIHLQKVLIEVTISIITLGTICIYLFVHFLFKPVKVIINTMNEITESEDLKEIGLKHKRDELGQIVMAFNQMILKIKDMVKRQESFVINVSHELKTPITIIEGYGKLLERWGLEDREVAKESIEHIIEETSRMKYGLIEPMLLLTSLKKRSIINDTIQLDLLAKGVAKKFEVISKRQIEIEGNGTVFSNRELIEQILYIFIDNSIKYSSSKIEIIVDDNFICVKDSGSGISEEDIPFIFDQFYRGNKERSDKKGVGLGLAIANDSANLLGAKLEYRANPKGGSMFSILFQND
ncbi:sensor histidine kinase [Gottfriedia luciferensis]|uniref:sensor histidine kinase n=1 Tax=Gottfriedia luciferensis TaxID=178774 RepID=UPI000B44D681|nr:HAMP domain-containing sensor histidine kinase [Gottfriedia luciferensis]